MKELNAVEKELLRLLRLKFSDNDGKSAAVEVRTFYTYRMGPKKAGHKLMTILSNLNRFKKIITGRCLGKFAVKRVLKIPSHLAHVAALPCETVMSAKQAINEQIQGSVANNKQIKKGLLLSARVKKKLNR